jgi:carboxymethylenebutenolidase
MFREALDRYGRKYEIHMYEGARHAFLNNPSGEIEANKKAAEQSAARTAKWLKKALA